jgi:hypothetical protein
MFVQQVAIWLRSPSADSFSLAHCHDSGLIPRGRCAAAKTYSRVRGKWKTSLYQVPDTKNPNLQGKFPIDNATYLRELGIARIVLVEKNSEVLALLGIGRDVSKANSSVKTIRS